MPAWWDTSTGHDYGLTVSGVQIIDRVPLDLMPIRWEEAGVGGVGVLTFTVEDLNGVVELPTGASVRLTDNARGVTLFGGVLLNKQRTRGPGSVVWTECRVASWAWFLDHRIVPRYSSKRNVGGRVRKIDSDRNIIIDLIRRKGGPIEAKYSNVDATNTSMDVLTMTNETLRSALEKIAGEASPGDGEATSATALPRHIYVDHDAQLHYFKGTEGLTAPYRISDSDYTTLVKGHADLIEYWSLREESGTTNYGLNGNDLTLAGTYTQGVTNIGVPGMPHYRATTFDGSSGRTAGSVVATVGDDWTIELWARRDTATGTHDLYHENTSGAPVVRFQDGAFQAIKSGTGLDRQRVGITSTDWQHLVVTHTSGNTTLYVDADANSGASTATYSSSAAPTLGTHTGGGTHQLPGSMQHVATYSAAIPQADVTAHYQQGISIAPENLRIEWDGEEDVHRVYVRGKNARGSGWVDEKGSPWEAGAAHAFVDAPWARTAAQRNRRGRAYMRKHGEVVGGSFSVLGLHGWGVGQLLPVKDDAIGVDSSYEIRGVSGELFAGSAARYDIEFGALSRRLTRAIRKRKLGDIILP